MRVLGAWIVTRNRVCRMSHRRAPERGYSRMGRSRPELLYPQGYVTVLSEPTRKVELCALLPPAPPAARQLGPAAATTLSRRSQVSRRTSVARATAARTSLPVRHRRPCSGASSPAKDAQAPHVGADTALDTARHTPRARWRDTKAERDPQVSFGLRVCGSLLLAVSRRGALRTTSPTHRCFAEHATRLDHTHGPLTSPLRNTFWADAFVTVTSGRSLGRGRVKRGCLVAKRCSVEFTH